MVVVVVPSIVLYDTRHHVPGIYHQGTRYSTWYNLRDQLPAPGLYPREFISRVMQNTYQVPETLLCFGVVMGVTLWAGIYIIHIHIISICAYSSRCRVCIESGTAVLSSGFECWTIGIFGRLSEGIKDYPPALIDSSLVAPDCLLQGGTWWDTCRAMVARSMYTSRRLVPTTWVQHSVY